jgi:hypothetical protein
MQHYIEIAMRFWSEFTTWTPPQVVLYTILGFGVLSAWIMTRFAAAAPLFVGPVSFITLTFAAMVSNFAARGHTMMGTTDLQKALLFTTLGHAIAGVILLGLFKASKKGAEK